VTLHPVLVSVILSIISILFASLITYFITTRNFDSKVSEIIKKCISEHEGNCKAKLTLDFIQKDMSDMAVNIKSLFDNFGELKMTIIRFLIKEDGRKED
jgi:hypothetical protein